MRRPRRASRSTGAMFGFAVLAATSLLLTVVVSLVRSTGSQTAATSSPPPAAPERFPNEWPKPPPADVAQLLPGLGPNTPLVGAWRVRGVSPVANGRIVIDVDRGDVGMRVWIVRRESDPHRPPATTERYALYWVQPRPAADSIDDQATSEVLGALVARIKQTESSVPMPAGL